MDQPTETGGAGKAAKPTPKVRLAKSSGGGTVVARASGERARPIYQDLLAGLYDAVLITSLDGDVMDANSRAFQFLQYTKQELLTMNVRTVFSSFDENLLERIRTHLDEGRFTVLDAYCVCKDKSTFPSETAVSRIRMMGKPSFVFSIRNISRRREMQEMLRTEHNALQNSASCIAIADMTGNLTYANPAFLKLWEYESIDDVRGKSITEFWENADDAAMLVERPVAGEEWVGELQGRSKSGTNFFVQASSAPNRDTKQRPVGIVFSFLDITSLKKAEQAIRKEVEVQLKNVRDRQTFGGRLNIVSISDVIQLIASTEKTGLLILTGQDRVRLGETAFIKGQIVKTSCDGKTGEEGFYTFFSREAEGFTFYPEEKIEKDPTITKTTMGLLLEAARIVDES